jgi:hypothetical protein
MANTFVAVFPLACVRKAIEVRNKRTIGRNGARPAAIYHRNVAGVICGEGKLHGACHVAWWTGFHVGIGCYIGEDGSQRWPS